MAASLNMLCEGSEGSYPLWWGQRSLCSRVTAAKCPSPAVPLWAAWEHGAFCFLVLAALHAPCVSVSPGETSEAAPRVADLRNEPRHTVFGFAAQLCWRAPQKAGWELSSCERLTLGYRQKVKAKEHRRGLAALVVRAAG